MGKRRSREPDHVQGQCDVWLTAPEKPKNSYKKQKILTIRPVNLVGACSLTFEPLNTQPSKKTKQSHLISYFKPKPVTTTQKTTNTIPDQIQDEECYLQIIDQKPNQLSRDTITQEIAKSPAKQPEKQKWTVNQENIPLEIKVQYSTCDKSSTTSSYGAITKINSQLTFSQHREMPHCSTQPMSIDSEELEEVYFNQSATSSKQSLICNTNISTCKSNGTDIGTFSLDDEYFSNDRLSYVNKNCDLSSHLTKSTSRVKTPLHTEQDSCNNSLTTFGEYRCMNNTPEADVESTLLSTQKLLESQNAVIDSEHTNSDRIKAKEVKDSNIKSTGFEISEQELKSSENHLIHGTWKINPEKIRHGIDLDIAEIYDQKMVFIQPDICQNICKNGTATPYEQSEIDANHCMNSRCNSSGLSVQSKLNSQHNLFEQTTSLPSSESSDSFSDIDMSFGSETFTAQDIFKYCHKGSRRMTYSQSLSKVGLEHMKNLMPKLAGRSDLESLRFVSQDLKDESRKPIDSQSDFTIIHMKNQTPKTSRKPIDLDTDFTYSKFTRDSDSMQQVIHDEFGLTECLLKSPANEPSTLQNVARNDTFPVLKNSTDESLVNSFDDVVPSHGMDIKSASQFTTTEHQKFQTESNLYDTLADTIDTNRFTDFKRLSYKSASQNESEIDENYFLRTGPNLDSNDVSDIIRSNDLGLSYKSVSQNESAVDDSDFLRTGRELDANDVRDINKSADLLDSRNESGMTESDFLRIGPELDSEDVSDILCQDSDENHHESDLSMSDDAFEDSQDCDSIYSPQFTQDSVGIYMLKASKK